MCLQLTLLVESSPNKAFLQEANRVWLSLGLEDSAGAAV